MNLIARRGIIAGHACLYLLLGIVLSQAACDLNGSAVPVSGPLTNFSSSREALSNYSLLILSMENGHDMTIGSPTQ